MKATWQWVGGGRACRWALLVSLAAGVPVPIHAVPTAGPAGVAVEEEAGRPPEFTTFPGLNASEDASSTGPRAALEGEGVSLAVDLKDVFCRSPVAFSDPVEGVKPGLQAAPSVAGVNSRGRLRVLLVRVVFSDQRTLPMSEAEARTLGRQAEEFFTLASHGALSLSAQVSPPAQVLASSIYQRGSEATLRAHAHESLVRDGEDPGAYDLDVILAIHASMRSQAYPGARGAWVSINRDLPEATLGTLLHELGHNLGLNHATGWRPYDQSVLGEGTWDEYGNPFDTMGTHLESRASDSFGQAKPFNAFNQHKLGWLPGENLALVAQSGVYRLLPVDAPNLTPGGTHALQLALPGARRYWIEARSHLPGPLIYGDMSGSRYNEPVLLNPRPGQGGGFFDAPLLVGRSLLDPDAGLRITPRLPPPEAPAGALDVEVRRVHHGFHEADAGVAEDAQVIALVEATEGRAVHLAGPEQAWSVRVSAPAAGRYLVWLRVKSAPGTLPLRVTPADGATFEATASAAPDWRWVRLEERPAGDSTNRRPALITLPAGPSAIVFEAMTEAWLDLVMLTDDASPNTPPYLSPLPHVRLVGDGALVRIPLSVTDLESGESSQLRLQARSLDTRLIRRSDPRLACGVPLPTNHADHPWQELEVCGAGANRELLFRTVPGALGSTTLHLRAVDGDGNGVSGSLSVSLLGPVQSLVEEAGPGGTVRLPPGVFRDRLTVSAAVTIEGGAAGAVIEAGGAGPVVQVAAGARVTLRDLTLRNGTRGIVNHGELVLERVTLTGHSVGGIDNRGVLHVRDSTVAGNSGREPGAGLRNRGEAVVWNSTFHDNLTSANGGAIANEGPLLELVQCTLSGNSAGAETDEKNEAEYAGRGGGLYNSGTVTLVACTLVQNLAGRAGGGLFTVANDGVLLVMQNTILAGNSVRRGAGPDGSGEVQSAGFNLVGDSADLSLVGDLQGNLVGQPSGLGPLADNGGPTHTHLPLPGSPALDVGAAAAATHDQRGVFRRVDVAGLADAADGTDIGAVEFTAAAPARVVPAAALDAAGGVAALSLAVKSDEALSGLAFTVHYPPALLRNPEVLAGPDAAGAALELNPGVSLPGRLGVRVRFPADRPATAAGRRVLNVVFEAARELRDPAQLRFEFGDEIEPRSAADAGGQTVPALFPPFVETAAAPPVLAVHPQADGRVLVSLTALPGARHEVEATADFEDWIPLGTAAVAADGVAVLEDADAAGQSHRFYRWRRTAGGAP